MSRAGDNSIRSILREVQRRVPAGQRFAQEAFTSDHRRVVNVKLNEMVPGTFYLFDEFAACAFREAVIDWAGRHGTGRLTISCGAYGEFQALQHRLQHVANKVAAIQVLAIGVPERIADVAPRMEVFNSNGGILARFVVAMKEEEPAFVFVAQEIRSRSPVNIRYLGFFTDDAETVDELAEDVELVMRGQARTLPAFVRLRTLHQTTQRVARELESYSRRMELVVQRARRRPDLLTPARFDRIVRQSIYKMEQLKEIPLRALRTLGKSHW